MPNSNTVMKCLKISSMLLTSTNETGICYARTSPNLNSSPWKLMKFSRIMGIKLHHPLATKSSELISYMTSSMMEETKPD